MKTRTTLHRELALAAILGIGLFSPMRTMAQNDKDHVEIHGEVLVDDTVRNGSLEVVEVDDRVCVPLVIHPNGRFELKLAAGDRAYLRFEKDGYLTKEILVDTRNANITRAANKKNKTVRFAVQMTPELADKQLAYAGPVGIITFLKGTGLMKVRYERNLVRNSAGDIVAINERN